MVYLPAVAVGATTGVAVRPPGQRMPAPRPAGALKVGNGLDEGVQMGPVITPQSKERIRSLIDKGTGEGATAVVDGRDTRVPGRGRKSLLFKCMERLADRVFPELHHRIATGLLVATGD